MMTTSIEHRRGLLALTLQEPLTAAVRLRANRQVAADADSFRTHIKQLLGQSDQEARRAGYDSDTVKLAVYAAQLDVVHSPHAQFWRAAAGCCGGHASCGEYVGKSEGTSAGSSVGRVAGRRKHSKCDPACGESCRAAQADGFVHGWYGAFDDDDSGDADGSRHAVMITK